MSEHRMTEELRKQIDEAATKSPDMNIPNNDDPVDDNSTVGDDSQKENR